MVPGQAESAILIETEKVNSGNLGTALASVEGCWKSSSILWMHVNGFPTLSGVVLGSWFPEGEESVRLFAGKNSFSELLLRIEKRRQRWTRRRGGYNIPISRVQETVNTVAEDEFLAILLEPASPYSDSYSLTSAGDVHTGKIDVEVVGPGFDASDTLRSDLTPHERFQITAGNKTDSSWERGFIQVSRTYLIDAEKYRGSVQRRLLKIGARLKNPAFPEGVMERATGSETDNLVRDATRYLKESGQTLLFDHADRYQPIPSGLLDTFVHHLLRFCRALAQSELSWKTFALSGSFLLKERLAIWDFFSPGSYDTVSLAKLNG